LFDSLSPAVIDLRLKKYFIAHLPFQFLHFFTFGNISNELSERNEEFHIKNKYFILMMGVRGNRIEIRVLIDA
jgi:hypothetical protein